jgi:hypothetical protein
MPDAPSGFRRSPFHVVKWLGHDLLQNHPMVRMLHESRALAAEREKALPLQERPSYQIRQKRIFARGREAEANAVAAPEAAAATDASPEATGEPTIGAPPSTDPPTA